VLKGVIFKIQVCSGGHLGNKDQPVFQDG